MILVEIFRKKPVFHILDQKIGVFNFLELQILLKILFERNFKIKSHQNFHQNLLTIQIFLNLPQSGRNGK